MTISEAIEQVHGRTGRRAEQNGVDMNFLLLSCLQEICMAARWPWRKKTGSLTPVVGTRTYDITSSSYGSVTDFEELKKAYRVDSTTSVVPLAVITDDDAIAAAQVDTTSADVTGIFLAPGTPDSFSLAPVPSSTKQILYIYWAIPSQLDSGSGTIPLLPARWHYVLVKRMEAAAWASLVKSDESTSKYQMCIAEYQAGLGLMLAKTDFSTSEIRNWKTGDEAVRSL